jgi:phage terminase Nu1 subunit (DNA packaging protein)
MNSGDSARAVAPVRGSDGARAAGERYVSRRELAELMGVSVDCVDYFVRLGMPSETWGLRRRVFKPSAALAWAREYAQRRAA